MPNFQVAQSVQSSKLKSAWLAKKRWIAAPMPCAWGNRQLATNKFKVKAAEGIWCPKTKAQDVHGMSKEQRRETPLGILRWFQQCVEARWSFTTSSSCQHRIQPPLSRAAAASPALRCAAADDSGPDRKQTHSPHGSPHSFQLKEEIVGIENLRCVLSLAVSFSWPGKLPLMIQMQAIAVASLRWMLQRAELLDFKLLEPRQTRSELLIWSCETRSGRPSVLCSHIFNPMDVSGNAMHCKFICLESR